MFSDTRKQAYKKYENIFLLISANHVMIDIFDGNGTKKDILVPTYV